MIKFGKWVVKYRVIILILGVLLLIPSVFGYIKTKINYDILSYLPNTLETVKGQEVMVDEYGMGAFSMIIVNDMKAEESKKLEEDIENVKHVKKVLSYTDYADASIPKAMIPERLKNALFSGDSMLMIAMFDDTTSSDATMNAITEIRKIVGKQAFVSGMGGVTTDIKELVEEQFVAYVIIAVIVSMVLLLIFTESWIVPLLFMVNIGMTILYNMGSNFMLSDVSYLTKALAAILQLAVTMDYSIFLLESFEMQKKMCGGDSKEAMAHAISNTFVSISSSSVTTVAGFAALMVMVFQLGANLGVVMMKGVVLGVLSCVTILPSIILVFDKAIDKTTHRPFVGTLDKLSKLIIKCRWGIVIVLALICVPAIYGSNNYEIYYNIAHSLPDNIPSAIANKKLEEEFDMKTTHVIMYNKNLDVKSKEDMIQKIEKVDGVKSVIGINSIIGPGIPNTMLPSRLRESLQSGKNEIMFVSSDYGPAIDKSNAQIAEIDKIVKAHQKDALVIGEAPLMKDLQDVNDVDLVKVNVLSIMAIFIIIMVTYKSISLPVILVAVIEFAISINMAVPYFMHTSLPFVTSVVIGTIQLGSTVDYAILFTSNYMKNRQEKNKEESIRMAQRMSMKSILTSGCCFFGVTCGVGLYSNIDMISSICMLLARGAVISMVIVMILLPTAIWLLDSVIIRTTFGMKKCIVSKEK
ncbi:efflux RND transporter permease subunit [Eubacterium xylanophilum]|uniref:efflux RND transporter permease subunit n=1 Tax=Eubacterium xylanophilum TaxID=39497 RepID=UPI00047D2EFC|nr:MMPL family transporter [Eubacterium xylanophilum]